MHTWALFSCSSLITLTAYNLTQFSQAQTAGPEPEPDPSSEFANDSKFSLEALSREFPENDAAIALPPLPNQPQMSKPSEVVGFNPAAGFPAKGINSAVAINQNGLSFPSPDKIISYRSEAMQPLPTSVWAPSPPPRPISTLIKAFPPPAPVAVSHPEQRAAVPSFARQAESVTGLQASASIEPENLSWVNPAGDAIAQGEPVVSATVEQSELTTPTNVSQRTSGELFAALPEPSTLVFTNDEPRQPENLMTANLGEMTVPLEALTERSAAAPNSVVSMAITVARQQLVNRYCERVRTDDKTENKLAVCDADTNELAQRMPEAATAGTPIPGKVESPTLSNPEIGVLQFGNRPLSAAIAGP